MYLSFELAPGASRRFSAGHSIFQLERGEDSWSLHRWFSATAAANLDPSDPSAEVPAHCESVRRGARTDSGKVEVRWIGSHLPIVARLGETHLLLPGQGRRWNLPVPVGLQVVVEGLPGEPLFDGLARQLSKTWYGSMSEGALGYHFECREAMPGAGRNEDIALCPVTVKNIADEPIEFRQAFLHLSHSPVYTTKAGVLAVPPVHLEYVASNIIGSARYDDDAPEGLAGLERIADPRGPVGKCPICNEFFTSFSLAILGLRRR